MLHQCLQTSVYDRCPAPITCRDSGPGMLSLRIGGEGPVDEQPVHVRRIVIASMTPGVPVIEVKALPRNARHVRRLIGFAGEFLGVCHDLGIHPVLDSGLAVFAHTRDAGIEVHDVDFSIHEAEFPRLMAAFERLGIAYKITTYHVLRAERDDLRIDLGSIEYWMQGIDTTGTPVRIGGVEFRMIGIEALREAYRRGHGNTAPDGNEPDPPKHQAIRARLRLLDAYLPSTPCAADDPASARE